MMKDEFEKRIPGTVTPEQWEKINTVYQFHPVIKDVGGKDQIAALYVAGGMFLIEDMFKRANEIEAAVNTRHMLDIEATAAAETFKQLLVKLKNDYEAAVMEAQDNYNYKKMQIEEARKSVQEKILRYENIMEPV